MKSLTTYCLLVIAVFITVFTACKQDTDMLPDDSTARVNVINATDAPLNFYLNGTRQNSTAGIAVLGNSGYTEVPAGVQILSFKRNFDKEGFNNTDTLFTLPQTLDSGAQYSIFVAGASRNTAFRLPDTLVAETDAKIAKVRFVNASATAPSFRIFINDTLRFNPAAFKAASGFNQIGAGPKTIKVYAVGTNTLLSTRVVTLTGKSLYTLVAKGAVNGAGDAAFTTGLIVNQ